MIWSGQYEYMERAKEKMKLVIPAIYFLWKSWENRKSWVED